MDNNETNEVRAVEAVAETSEAPQAAAAPAAAAPSAPAASHAPSGDRPQRSYSDRGERPQRGGPRPRRRKVCQFCVDRVEEIDYKDVNRLRKFISERAKIIPRRVTGTCARHQRELTTAIKRARQIALLPYISD